MDSQSDLIIHLAQIEVAARCLVFAQLKGNELEIHVANTALRDALVKYGETSFDASLALQEMVRAYLEEWSTN